MSLRYSFRHLFFGGKLNKRRLYNILEDLDSANGGESTDITELETAIGKAEGTGAGGILKDIKDIKDAIGTATGDDANGIAKDVADAQSDITALETAIGDESTKGTILARIKALEDAG